ncbi:MAG: efflux RND transporter periplasmic adaptor subunit [Treponema sp.]|jgi:multidrug efflux pump subunit AcrA (membrane-fusion protein)|nr:efflux RND transporter periplasmic adaptor subunit [Treponema sp.]
MKILLILEKVFAKLKIRKNAVFALAVWIGMFSSCGNSKFTAVGEEPRFVRTAAAVFRDGAEEIKGFGSISFQRKTDIAAPSDAILKKLLKREGDYIKKGDIAAVLENYQISLAVRRAESAFAQAQAAMELARARLIQGEFQSEVRLLENKKLAEQLELVRKSLNEQRRKQKNNEIIFEAGGISEEAIIESRFSLSTAEAEERLMQKELELKQVGIRKEDLAAAGFHVPEDEDELRGALIALCTADLRAEAKAAEANLDTAARELESNRFLESELIIKSPLSGIVGVRYFEEGERLKREDSILTIIETSELYAMFPVSESDAPKLKEGMTAIVSIDGTGSVYEGKVDLVYPQADSQTFSFMVRVLLPGDNNGFLKPGMFARITIPVEKQKNIIVIPEAALTAKKEKNGKVFIIRGNILSERSVSLGRTFGEEREIISGVESGEVVVLRPEPSLRDGSYVTSAN